MRKQTTFFSSICLTIFAIVSSLHGNGLTGNDIVEQARDDLVRYKQGDGIAYYRLDATRDERLFPVFLEALNDSDANVRILAINQLTNYKKVEAIGPISDVLKHASHEGVRAAAASSLDQLGHQEANRHLLDALSDRSANVERAAIRGLGRLKSKESIESLKEKLRGDNEEDWEVQRAAADALQDITGEDWSRGIHEFSPSSECAMRTLRLKPISVRWNISERGFQR